MPRAIWSGTVSLGLISIPVQLFSVVQSKTVRFSQLHGADHGKVTQRRMCAHGGQEHEVAYEDLAKGFEIAPDQYVVIEPDELAALAPRATRTIDLSEFVAQADIDPLLYNSSYYLAPAAGGEKAYRTLQQAMEGRQLAAVGSMVMRSKQHLVAIRAGDQAMVLSTLTFHDEINDPQAISAVADAGAVEPAEAEVAMAGQLIDALVGPFEPERFRDEYREQVLDLIERKAAGEPISVAEPESEPEPVPDLMAALQASLQAVTPAGRRTDPATPALSASR